MNVVHLKLVVARILYDIFLVSFSVFIVSFLLEAQLPGVVARWVNINSLLAIAFLSGFVALVSSSDQHDEAAAPSYGYWFGATAISIAAGWIVWRMSLSLGPWAFVAAAGVGLIIFLAGAILAFQDTTKHDHD